MDNLREKTFKGYKWTSILVASNVFVNSIILISLGYLLNTDEIGLRAIILFLIGLARTLSEFGISQALIQRQENNSSELNALFTFNIAIGLVMAGVMYILAVPLSLFYQHAELIPLVHLTSIVFLVEPLSLVFVALLERNMNFKVLAKLNLIRLVVNGTFTIITAYIGWGEYSFVVGQLISTIVFTLFIATYFKIWGDWFPKFTIRILYVKPYLNFGIFISGKSFVNYFSRNFDELVIGKMFGMEILGIYHFAKQVIDRIIDSTVQVTSKVTYPIFCNMTRDSKDNAVFNLYYLKLSHVVGTFGFPVFSLLIVLIPQLLPIMFSNKWDQSIFIMQIFCAKGLVDIISAGFATNSLYAFNKTKWAFYTDLTLLPVRVLMMYFACLVNINLVAVSYTLFVLLKAGVLQSLVNKLTGIKYKYYLRTLSKPLLASSLITSCLLYLIQNSWPIYWLVISTIGFILLYIALMLLWDRQIILEIMNEAKKILKKKNKVQGTEVA